MLVWQNNDIWTYHHHAGQPTAATGERWSPRRLAQVAEVPKDLVYRLDAGEARYVDLQALTRLCDALHYHADEILVWKGGEEGRETAALSNPFDVPSANPLQPLEFPGRWTAAPLYGHPDMDLQIGRVQPLRFDQRGGRGRDREPYSWAHKDDLPRMAQRWDEPVDTTALFATLDDETQAAYLI